MVEGPVAAVAAPGVLRVGDAGARLAGAPGGAGAGRLRAGVLVPVAAVRDGWARITTPCELTRWMPVTEGTGVPQPVVVLDPGHGGDERGAVGSGGLTEKALNLEVARKVQGILESEGVRTVLTRTGDYRATLNFRVALARAADPEVLVSIHHNADPDGDLDKPGTETYYQFRSSSSKRLAGLIYEEVVKDLSTLDARWVGDTDAGAKWRLNNRGADYYGILRISGGAGITTAMAELAFVSNPAEEALLSRPEVQELEARAVARGITRYLRTNDPGGGFTTPYPRQQPAGPGGGAGGCVDPA